MASYTLSALAGAGAQFFDNNGNVLSGGKIYTYQAGTTTLAATYANNLGSATNTNPIVLDSAGRPPQEIWFPVGQTFKFIVKTSTDTLIGTYDNIPSINDPYSEGNLLSNVTGTNAIAATASPTITAYSTGAAYSFIAANTNSGAVTLAIDGLTAKAITKAGSNALVAGDIQSGMLVYVHYDGTRFQMIGNAVYGGSVTNATITGSTITGGSVSGLATDLQISDGGTGASTALAAFDNLKQPASTAYVGAVELATDAEAIAGTDTTRVITPAVFRAANIVSGASVASTSGTNIEFTGIPAWAKRITIMMAGVSTSGTAVTLVQLGSTSFETTGYLSSSTATVTASATVNYTNGFAADFGSGNTAAAVRHGAITLTNISGNTWIATGAFGLSNAAYTCVIGGSKSLANVLDRVRITTSNGTDTFDAGTMNIMWE